jgi:hypothetical protein
MRPSCLSRFSPNWCLWAAPATALLITDKAAADGRPTFDVDAIAEITSYAGYDTFSERLKKLWFHEDTREDAPRCRWR